MLWYSNASLLPEFRWGNRMPSARQDFEAKLDAVCEGIGKLKARVDALCTRQDAVKPPKEAEAEFSAVERERDEMKEKVRAALKSGSSLKDIEKTFGARQQEIEKRFKAASNAVVVSRDTHGWPAERR